jgi:hypothetical protein
LRGSISRPMSSPIVQRWVAVWCDHCVGAVRRLEPAEYARYRAGEIYI